MLGIWFQKTEGSKFSLQVLTEMRQRGVGDVLVCCVDGLAGFADAIGAVFSQTWVQTCLVHYPLVMPTWHRSACCAAEKALRRSA